MEKGNIIAIDPGKDKVGIAILSEKGELLEKMIIFMDKSRNFTAELQRLVKVYKIKHCAMGNGTRAREYADMVKESGLESPVLVDERNTTLLARERYFKENPPKGIKRLIPLSFQVPPVPLDAYAAVIIGERYLNLHFKGEF